MTPTEQQEKLSQFTEFFTIAHEFSVNIETLPDSTPISMQAFDKLIPLPFKLASDNAVIDQKALRPIQHLSTSASQLVDYLHHQANKIDLLVNYILSQHDDEEKRFAGLEFGGGGFSFAGDNSFELGQVICAKLFLLEQNCAVYCHGEIIEKTLNDASGETHYKVLFAQIREDDRELMVRTSLHIQSKQLQALAQKRNTEAKSDN